jgi:hypothetical protein
LKIKLKSKNSKIKSIPKKNCPCAGKHSFQCGNTYCATNQSMCTFFKTNLKTSSHLITKRCYNHIWIGG